MANPKEISAETAWRIISRWHLRQAHRDFGHFLNTGELDLGQTERVETIFPLMLDGKYTIYYDVERRRFKRNHDDICRLTKIRHTVFVELLLHPETVRSSRNLYNILYPYNSGVDDEAINSSIRPLMSHLRTQLEEIHPDLRSIIVTYRDVGYMYSPHKSIQLENRRGATKL